jgi:hypothetical protein
VSSSPLQPLERHDPWLFSWNGPSRSQSVSLLSRSSEDRLDYRRCRVDGHGIGHPDELELLKQHGDKRDGNSVIILPWNQ